MYQNRERLSKVRDLEDAALMYSRKQLQVEAKRAKTLTLIRDPKRTGVYR